MYNPMRIDSQTDKQNEPAMKRTKCAVCRGPVTSDGLCEDHLRAFLISTYAVRYIHKQGARAAMAAWVLEQQSNPKAEGEVHAS